MLRAIETHLDIVKLNKKFGRLLRQQSDNHVKTYIGYQGGNRKCVVFASTSEMIWWAAEEYEDHLWNPFGMGLPKENKNHSITVNLTLRYKQSSCFFAYNEQNEIVLAHTGRIGGSRKNITKDGFWRHYRGESDDLWTRKGIKRVALVTNLSSHLLLEEVAYFVKEVDRIKNTLNSKDERLDGFSYKPEFQGEYKYSMNKTVSVKSYHGIVVDKLRERLVHMGHAVSNEGNDDLVIYNPNNEKVTHLFEVKSSISTTNLYGAIGQLYYYSLKLPKNCVKILVAPNDIGRDMKLSLAKLKIRLITYSLKGKSVRFQNLSKL